VESLGGGDVDSIRQRSNDKSRTVAKVLVAVRQAGISNAEEEVILLGDENTLELNLPQEVVLMAATTVPHVTDHITRVSVHGDETHELSTERLVDGRMGDHTDEATEVLDLIVVTLLHGILLAILVSNEGLLTIDDPVGVV